MLMVNDASWRAMVKYDGFGRSCKVNHDQGAIIVRRKQNYKIISDRPRRDWPTVVELPNYNPGGLVLSSVKPKYQFAHSHLHILFQAHTTFASTPGTHS
jgi:hypothetical protein